MNLQLVLALLVKIILWPLNSKQSKSNPLKNTNDKTTHFGIMEFRSIGPIEKSLSSTQCPVHNRQEMTSNFTTSK